MLPRAQTAGDQILSELIHERLQIREIKDTVWRLYFAGL